MPKPFIDQARPVGLVNGPITRDGLRVCTTRCSTCIFRPGDPMRLQPGRVRGMVEAALADDAFIVCHQTLDAERAVCRGFYDAYGDRTLGCRLAHVYGVIPLDPV